MPEIKRIVEIREVCYYDGNNGSYIVDVFFEGSGATLVSEVDGVLTVNFPTSGGDHEINAGQYAVRNYKGDTQWRYTMVQQDLDAYYTVVGTSPR